MLRGFFIAFLLTISINSFGHWMNSGNQMTTNDILNLTVLVRLLNLEMRDSQRGQNNDLTAFYRTDKKVDFSKLKLQLGDEPNAEFQIRYQRYTDQIWVPQFSFNKGKLGIGIEYPKHLLDVNGLIHAKEVKVDLTGWSDFVFEQHYHLPDLDEVEKFIKENGHLENIPNEKEVVENGVKLGEMDRLLLRKIEELMLYSIDQNKRIKKLEAELAKCQI